MWRQLETAIKPAALLLPAALLGGCANPLLCGCGNPLLRVETTVLLAVDDVQFADPENAGVKRPRIIGTLPAGGSMQVSQCRPQQHGADVIVMLNGMPAVAVRGTFKLKSRYVDPRLEPASADTGVCRALLPGTYIQQALTQ
jgi:hypothetical protein